MTGTTKFRRPLAAALTLGVAIALAACSTPAPAPSESGDAGSGDKALRIGFSPFSLQIPAFIGLSQGLTAIAEGQGDTVVTADAKGDPSTQLQQIQQWVDLGQVDAIWVIPMAASSVATVLTDATAKGIVVIASGVPEDYGYDGPQAGITFTNVDNADYGTKLATLATDCISERLDGKGKIIYVQSPIGAQSSDLINDAVKSTITDQSPDSTIVSGLDSAVDRLANGQQISTALQGNPDANVIIGTDDEASLGALDALDQAGIDPSSICVIGAGGSDEAKAAVTAKKLFGEVAFDFGADIGQNIGELHALAADPTVAGKQLTTPIQVITE